MIPSLHIVAWGRAVPWAEPRQVEQDLIIFRAVVALFDDPFHGDSHVIGFDSRRPDVLTFIHACESIPEATGRSA